MPTLTSRAHVPVRTLASAAVSIAAVVALAGCGSSSDDSSSSAGTLVSGASATLPGAATATTDSGVGAASVTTDTSDADTTDTSDAGVTDTTGTGTGSTAASSADAVAVCDLLPASTVAQVTGEAITKAAEDDTPSYHLSSCTYASDDGTQDVDVSVLQQDTAAAFGQEASETGTTTPISGLGDQAYSAITGVHALFGDTAITVSNLASDTAAEALIRDLQPEL